MTEMTVTIDKDELKAKLREAVEKTLSPKFITGDIPRQYCTVETDYEGNLTVKSIDRNTWAKEDGHILELVSIREWNYDREKNAYEKRPEDYLDPEDPEVYEEIIDTHVYSALSEIEKRIDNTLEIEIKLV